MFTGGTDDGTRWKACSIKQLQHSCAGLLTSAIEYYEGADVTLRDILDANLIQAVIREVHLLHDIRSEFASLRWSMGANEPLPSWSELGPPAATAAADAVNRLGLHLQTIREERRAATEGRQARTTLRGSLAAAALQRLQALQCSGVVILPPPQFAPPTAVVMEGY